MTIIFKPVLYNRLQRYDKLTQKYLFTDSSSQTNVRSLTAAIYTRHGVYILCLCLKKVEEVKTEY
ncbi:hypothetical protein JCM6292_941 [Bacteroides pyogenes JCM 6292]|uniref:Uncharacterized protein n=2 Tax=Bacteroides pyogenes TaxID=310300 RepID=W4PEB0_9BACE|nr:hypothetical protein JCM6292_941 [Bacteroides pyogenes JCM 6292]GAE17499.1 hypothetical protein JCM6294_257 [Bacteroides pyogenes DSM 20611 = JCM 6294]